MMNTQHFSYAPPSNPTMSAPRKSNMIWSADGFPINTQKLVDVGGERSDDVSFREPPARCLSPKQVCGGDTRSRAIPDIGALYVDPLVMTRTSGPMAEVPSAFSTLYRPPSPIARSNQMQSSDPLKFARASLSQNDPTPAPPSCNVQSRVDNMSGQFGTHWSPKAVDYRMTKTTSEYRPVFGASASPGCPDYQIARTVAEYRPVSSEITSPGVIGHRLNLISPVQPPAETMPTPVPLPRDPNIFLDQLPRPPVASPSSSPTLRPFYPAFSRDNTVPQAPRSSMTDTEPARGEILYRHDGPLSCRRQTPNAPRRVVDSAVPTPTLEVCRSTASLAQGFCAPATPSQAFRLSPTPEQSYRSTATPTQAFRPTADSHSLSRTRSLDPANFRPMSPPISSAVLGSVLPRIMETSHNMAPEWQTVRDIRIGQTPHASDACEAPVATTCGSAAGSYRRPLMSRTHQAAPALTDPQRQILGVSAA